MLILFVIWKDLDSDESGPKNMGLALAWALPWIPSMDFDSFGRSGGMNEIMFSWDSGSSRFQFDLTILTTYTYKLFTSSHNYRNILLIQKLHIIEVFLSRKKFIYWLLHKYDWGNHRIVSFHRLSICILLF